MIEKIDNVLVVWGDEYRRGATGAALTCSLAALIDGGGVIIRGTQSPGSVALYSGELGGTGEAVESALVQLRLKHSRGDELLKLARVRYLTSPMPLVEHQMRRMRYRSSDTYRNRLHSLHEALEPLLLQSLPWLKRSA